MHFWFHVRHQNSLETDNHWRNIFFHQCRSRHGPRCECAPRSQGKGMFFSLRQTNLNVCTVLGRKGAQQGRWPSDHYEPGKRGLLQESQPRVVGTLLQSVHSLRINAVKSHEADLDGAWGSCRVCQGGGCSTLHRCRNGRRGQLLFIAQRTT